MMFETGDKVVPLSTYFGMLDVYIGGKSYEILMIHNGMYETTCGILIWFGDEKLFVLESVYKSKLFRALK